MSTWLLTWNPDRWDWEDLDATVARVRKGRRRNDRWSCGVTRSIRSGDRLFLLRQGKEPRGIFASGWAVSDAYPDEHWDEDAPSSVTMYVELRFDALLNPEKEVILSRQALDVPVLREVHWNTQRSGIRINDKAAAVLERIWAGTVRGKKAPTVVPAQEAQDAAGTGAGGGFGNAEENAKIEAAAIDDVRRAYRADGWQVESVERQRCGFDLKCSRGSDRADVEVKGVSGKALAFMMTANEVEQANQNPNFVICIVTSALLPSRKIAKYRGPQFLSEFFLQPTQYHASLRNP